TGAFCRALAIAGASTSHCRIAMIADASTIISANPFRRTTNYRDLRSETVPSTGELIPFRFLIAAPPCPSWPCRELVPAFHEPPAQLRRSCSPQSVALVSAPGGGFPYS